MIECLTQEGPKRQEWIDLWVLTGREPFAHPEYGALFATDGAASIAVVDRQPGGVVLMPLLVRQLPQELRSVSAGGTSASTWCDAVSPYGYGGPYAYGDVDWELFYRSLVQWMRGQDIVACFVRAQLGHQLTNLEVPGCVPVVLSENVQVDLSRPPEVQWRHYAHKVRKNVRKATAAGLVATVRGEGVDVSEVSALYLDTMARRDADLRYRFDRTFFDRLLDLPGSAAIVAEVRTADGLLVSVEVVLAADRHLYSFLGGTRSDFFPVGPNDLLKTAVVEYGHSTGRDHYVLGGGLTRNDGIFRYKQTFDKDGVVPFTGVRVVADDERYERLCAAAGSARACGEMSYFPAYRDGRASSVV